MGELHLEIIVDRLKREFKVECNQAPQVNYKEAITRTLQHTEVYKKQTGRGKFAKISVEVSPAALTPKPRSKTWLRIY